MTNNIDKQSFGTAGAVIVTAEALAAGSYCAFQCVTDVVFTSIAAPLLTGDITDATYPAGFVLYTPFTACVVASGTLVAYKASF